MDRIMGLQGEIGMTPGKDSDNVKIATLVCGTVMIGMLLYTDGIVAASAAAAASAACFGIGSYLGKK
jgi:hypothetical protein